MADSRTLTNFQIYQMATNAGFDYKALKAIIQVESGQHGFSEKTGKILIQFEPAWCKREYMHWKTDTTHTLWQSNGVGDQTQEWAAFNDAFAIDPDAAMKSTSIGMMQVMGFHYSELGFKTVGAMWDYAKINEANQVALAIKFIQSVPPLNNALKAKDWDKVAYYYNGANYKEFHYADRLAASYRLCDSYTLSQAA